jgi:CRP-like cAMP-binding protein
MIDERRHVMRRAADRLGPRPIHHLGDPDVADLIADDPRIFLERGQVLFTEGDTPSCMYVVMSGALQIRSGGVIFENIGPGAIVGEMGLIEKHQLRTATVYALADSELVEVNGARFLELVARAPSFALAVMQVLSRRLRVMDRRYRH